MNTSIGKRIDPFSPAMLTNPLAVQVPPQLAGGYSALGATLSFVYWSIHWTMGASVFCSLMILGILRDRPTASLRRQARPLNELAAQAWAKVNEGAENAALQELMMLYQAVPNNPQVQFYLSRVLAESDAERGKQLMVNYISAMREKNQPCDPRAYLTLGQHCALLGNTAEADWVWREGHRVSSDDAMRTAFLLARALLYADDNPRQALEILEAAPINATLAPSLFCDLRYWRGRCLAAQGYTEWARHEFLAVAAVEPHYHDVPERLREMPAEIKPERMH